MKNTAIIIAAAIALSACDESPSTPEQKYHIDECIRSQVFDKCVEASSAGLASVNLHEDGDGIGDHVRACDRAAYYQSKRLAEVVSKECDGGGY